MKTIQRIEAEIKNYEANLKLVTSKTCARNIRSRIQFIRNAQMLLEHGCNEHVLRKVDST